MASRILTFALVFAGAAAPGLARPEAVRDPAEAVRALDAALGRAWAEAGVKPAPLASDAAYLRRVSLDLAGVVPAEERVRRFVASKRKGKRARLVRELLAGRNAANWQARRWANLLLGRSYLLRRRPDGGSTPLVRWLQRRFLAGAPWDRVVRELLTASGAEADNGAVEYFGRWEGKPEELAGNAMRVFQGQQVQCAQCHDHPYHEQWKQRTFWGVAAFFARVRIRRDPDTQALSLKEAERGEVRLPGPPGQPGPVIAPRFVSGESVDPGPGAYRREELARMLTAPGNPNFARATVNRVWGFLFGEAFTSPDDLAKPALPEVLEDLEEDFRASGYDLRRLLEVIVLSRAYQASSSGGARDRPAEVEVFARARVRPLTAEQLWWSLDRVLDVRAALEFQAQGRAPGWAREREVALRRRFFRAFGTTEAGAEAQQSLTQALLLLNGPLTNGFLRADRSPLVAELLGQPPARRVERLFLRALARLPSGGERRALGKVQRPEALQDVGWALLNCGEFVTNH
ncbi:MAG: DUF1549 domain-containing protein [Planctomycetota bacterium]|nr:MAG: DUF1549 domain-containing protein [Planctomycetota bacterium]